MNKPTATVTPPINGPTERPRRMMPADLQAAGRIDQILLQLSINEADWVLKRAMDMHKHRCELANRPPFVPEGHCSPPPHGPLEAPK